MKPLLARCMTIALAASLTCAVVTRAAEEAKKQEPAPKPGGRLQVEKDVIDVGDIVRGEEAKATFVLKNTGDQTLKILSAKPG